MIARIAADARIAQLCDQRSLRLNGNCLFTFASDPCVNSDPSDRDRKCSISAIAALLASTDFLMETRCHEFRRSRPPSQVICLFAIHQHGNQNYLYSTAISLRQKSFNIFLVFTRHFDNFAPWRQSLKCALTVHSG